MTQKPTSRQRKSQLRNLAAGKCKLCPRTRFVRDDGLLDPLYCAKHRKSYRKANRARMKRVRASIVPTHATQR